MPKEADITVGGEMFNTSFSGQNLHSWMRPHLR